MENLKDYLMHIYNLGYAHHPLEEWIKINYDLNKKYKEYGIGDDKYGTNVKNTARHFTGGALGNIFYGDEIANWLGGLKEKADSKRDGNKPWYDEDTIIDKANNIRGMMYGHKNPRANRQNVYDAAIQYAINNYNSDYPQK